jgi:serine/threonine protein kinase
MYLVLEIMTGGEVNL